MNCPVMQTTLSQYLVVYASMNNQSLESNLTPRIKVTLTRTGILDCRGKPLLHKLEQITMNDVKIEGLQPQLGERRQIHLHDQQLPAELKELVKTDNVEEIHLVQVTVRVAALCVVKFKSNCNHDKFTKYELFFIERGVDLPVELK